MNLRPARTILALSLTLAAPAFPTAASAQEDDPGLNLSGSPPPFTPPPRTSAPPSPPSSSRPPTDRAAPPAAGATKQGPKPSPVGVPGSEQPVKEEITEETKVLPPTNVSDDEWERHLMAPSLVGGIGLLHMQTAEVGAPLHFRVGLHVQGFSQDQFLIAATGSPGQSGYQPGDSNERFLGDLVVGLTGPDLAVLRNLELYLAIFNSSNQNKRTDPGRSDPAVILALADVALGLKGAYEVMKGLNVGANFGVRFFNSISAVSANFSATNFDINALGSFDLRPYVSYIPVRVHLNAGYYVDRSLNLLPTAQCATSTGNDPCIRSRVVETFAYGLDAQRARIALAADVPLRFHVPWGIFGLEPFVEYHVEVAAGSGDATVAKALESQADKDQGNCAPTDTACLARVADFRHRIQNPLSQFMTIGLRARPIGGLVVDFGVDLALQSPGFQFGPPIPVWNIIAGASYAFDTTGPIHKLTTKTITRTYELNKKAAESHIAITILDAKTRKPIGGAIVAWPGRGLSAQASGDDGKVLSYGLPAGPASIEVTHPGYEDTTAETSVESDATRPLEVLMKPRPVKESKLNIRVLDDRGTSLAGATVKVVGGNDASSHEALYDGDRFVAPVSAGEYTISVDAPSYLAKEKQVVVQSGQEMNVDFTLHKRPAKSHVEMAGDQILIRGTIHFATNEATILPDGQQILDEVIDILAKNPQIRKVSVEGHTDNQGPAEKNLQLSKDRAAAVVIYMVRNGVAREHLSSEGYGMTKPLVPNLTPANRARNRRVEFRIKDQGGATEKPSFRE
jgi:outer membrane protein OmpA-like peptidoglycan-associated protein